ncbi:geranyl geranyl pyrophosphate synthase, putative [Ricinus communis]|uniref:Geranyl geranyl pyrophosphate synthase, putative n=2 Tax=Ricinus communis TaxID=3988 RepID=B9T2V1_RICCO|nr:geranyl geranyl pyrophosphate synthase, putative [Ricinus communis]|eukprot:XP_002532570.1 heterodimeric geranylgeranyl pyrophosphate synthase small subunit, chloroplastic [Ricinus communis]
MAGALPYIPGNPVGRGVFRRSFGYGRGGALFSRRPVACVMSNSSKIDYWTCINADIETHLKEAIPVRPPVVVFEPMHHLTFAAPRSFAPALCIAACELVGGSRDQALAAASALRLMIAAAFTHENIPLTDRPRPSARPMFHHTFGPNIELLTGDGMIPFAFELLAQLNNPAQDNSDRILRVMIEISRAMGSQGMVEGQYNEFQYDQSVGDELFHVAWLRDVCKKKEGASHACAGACGAILGGGNEEEIEKLRRYGLYVGTIQGIYNKVEGNEEWSLKEVNKLRDLALKELKDFNEEEKVRAICSLVEN